MNAPTGQPGSVPFQRGYGVQVGALAAALTPILEVLRVPPVHEGPTPAAAAAARVATGATTTGLAAIPTAKEEAATPEEPAAHSG